jgi:hypothetical protein
VPAPKCLHPTCGRADLPPAAAFPLNLGIGPAHVTPKGLPCPFSPGRDVYDAEVVALIVGDDALWDLDAPPLYVPPTPLSEAVAKLLPDKYKARKPAKAAKKAPDKPASPDVKEVQEDDVDRWDPSA